MSKDQKKIEIVFRTSGVQKTESDIKRLSKATHRMSGSVRKATRGTSDGFEKTSKDVGRASTSMRRNIQGLSKSVATMFSGAALSLATRRFLQVSDAYTNLVNKLNVVSKSQGHLNLLIRETFDLAQQTSSDWEATAMLFARTAGAVESMGYSQREVLELTELINKAVLVSGVSSVEATNAIRQLVQGLASGVLQGQELASVLEQTGYFAIQLGKGMGIGIGEMRKAAEKRLLTTERIFEAVKKQGDVIRADFSKMTPTVQVAMVLLGNAAKKYIGELNRSLGATSGAAQGIIFFSKNLEHVGKYVIPLVVIASLVALQASLKMTLRLLLANPFALTIVALTSLGVYLLDSKEKIDKLKNAFSYLADVGRKSVSFLVKSFKKLYDILRSMGSLVPSFINLPHVLKLPDLDAIDSAAGKLRSSETPLSKTPVDDARRKAEAFMTAKVAGAKDKKAIATFKETIELMERENSLLRMTTEQRKVQEVVYLLETKMKRDLTDVEKERIVALVKTNLLLSTGKQKTQERLSVYAETIAALNQENALLQLNTEQRRIQGAILDAEAKMKRALTQSERERLTSLVLYNQQLTEEQELLQQMEGSRETLAREIDTLNRLYEKGAVSIETYQAQLQRLSSEMGETTQQGFTDSMRLALSGTKSLQSIMGDFVFGVGGLVDGLSNKIVEFARTGKLSLQSFAAELAATVLKAVTKLLLLKTLSAALGIPLGGGGGGGGAQNTAASALGNAGGKVAETTASSFGERFAGAFAQTAGTFAASGLSSLAQRHGDSARREPASNFRIVNVVSPKESLAMMESSAGEKLIMNVIERNTPTLRKMVGAT